MEVFVEAKETIWNIHRKTMISSLSPEVCFCLFVHLSVPNGFRTLPPEVKLRLCHHLISMSWMIVGEEDKMKKKKERENLWINPQPPRPPVPPSLQDNSGTYISINTVQVNVFLTRGCHWWTICVEGASISSEKQLGLLKGLKKDILLLDILLTYKTQITIFFKMIYWTCN